MNKALAIFDQRPRSRWWSYEHQPWPSADPPTLIYPRVIYQTRDVVITSAMVITSGGMWPISVIIGVRAYKVGLWLRSCVELTLLNGDLVRITVQRRVAQEILMALVQAIEFRG
jgi:hypothetical protein